MAASSFVASTPRAMDFDSSSFEKLESQAKNPSVPRTVLPWQTGEPTQGGIDFDREIKESSFILGSRAGHAKPYNPREAPPISFSSMPVNTEVGRDIGHGAAHEISAGHLSRVESCDRCSITLDKLVSRCELHHQEGHTIVPSDIATESVLTPMDNVAFPMPATMQSIRHTRESAGDVDSPSPSFQGERLDTSDDTDQQVLSPCRKFSTNVDSLSMEQILHESSNKTSTSTDRNLECLSSEFTDLEKKDSDSSDKRLFGHLKMECVDDELSTPSTPEACSPIDSSSEIEPWIHVEDDGRALSTEVFITRAIASIKKQMAHVVLTKVAEKIRYGGSPEHVSCAGSGNKYSASPESGGVQLEGSSSAIKGKRRTAEDHDSAQEDIPKVSKTRKKRGAAPENSSNLPCPYYFYYQNFHVALARSADRPCNGQVFPDINRLKEHLIRVHYKNYQCPRCLSVSPDISTFREHTGQIQACSWRPRELGDGFDAYDLAILKEKKPSQSPEEITQRWNEIFQLIIAGRFPQSPELANHNERMLLGDPENSLQLTGDYSGVPITVRHQILDNVSSGIDMMVESATRGPFFPPYETSDHFSEILNESRHENGLSVAPTNQNRSILPRGTQQLPFSNMAASSLSPYATNLQAATAGVSYNNHDNMPEVPSNSNFSNNFPAGNQQNYAQSGAFYGGSAISQDPNLITEMKNFIQELFREFEGKTEERVLEVVRRELGRNV